MAPGARLGFRDRHRQGARLDGHIFLTLNDGENLSSLAQAARFSIKDERNRMKTMMNARRVEDVVMGDDTMAFHLVDADNFQTMDLVGTLHRQARFTILFSLTDKLSAQERQEIIDSVLATWEFIDA